ncbi:hypothetical protein M3Y97_01113900 [Aphelenchoides bicaudatus]|nr:hypothetical protein M3Y97_01113900 [Aphelenchoides bicaudatus]
MKFLLACFLFVCFLSVAIVEARRCYVCNVLGAPSCDHPRKDYCEYSDQSCVKIIASDGSYSEGCLKTSDGGHYRSTGCRPNGGGSRACTCNSDLCNSAFKQSGLQIATASLIVSVVAFMFHN